MAQIVAGLLTIVAMGASHFAGNDPMTCLTRGALAFVAGTLVSRVWLAFFDHRSTVLSLVPAPQPVPAESETEAEAA